MKVQSLSAVRTQTETRANETSFTEVAPSALQAINGGLGTVAGGPGSIYTSTPSDPIGEAAKAADMAANHGGSCPGFRFSA